MPLRARTAPAAPASGDPRPAVRRRVGPGQQVVQQRPDRLEVRDDVDGGRRQRPGHAGELGGLRVLDDDRAAGSLTSAAPAAPSEPVPVRITAIRRSPKIWAALASRRSIDGLGVPAGPAERMAWSVISTSRLAGTT